MFRWTEQRCFNRWAFCLNMATQSRQANGFSPVWTLRWVFKFQLIPNCLPQYSQRYSLTGFAEFGLLPDELLLVLCLECWWWAWSCSDLGCCKDPCVRPKRSLWPPGKDAARSEAAAAAAEDGWWGQGYTKECDGWCWDDCDPPSSLCGRLRVISRWLFEFSKSVGPKLWPGGGDADIIFRSFRKSNSVQKRAV